MPQQRVLDAINQSGVKHIAIVDDAFDPPQLDEKDWGILLDLLEDVDSETIRREANITEGTWTGAKEALQNSDYTAEELLNCIALLYRAYLEEFDTKFDPGGRFQVLKADNLKYVQPIIVFLRSCQPNITVSKFGAEVGEMEVGAGELVVFVDLFLNAKIDANKDPEREEAQLAVHDSLKRIEPLMKHNPSVILMSSHSERQERNEYREKINGGESNIYASRFAFIAKRQISLKDEQIAFEHEALNTLLDIFQSYKFGRGLHAAFQAWVNSAEKAIKEMQTEVEALELRDISYLVRFRLADEGQSLPEYLEWLLAECLVDTLGKQLDQHTSNVPELLHLNAEEAMKIGGAFDGPTPTVADLYHRVRIENKREVARKQFRLGDLYLKSKASGTDQLIVVMNPDCDLVTRPKAGRNARSLLTLKGELQDFNAPKTSVGDFIIVNGTARNINWDYKDIETLPFSGPMENPGLSLDGYQYIGALRPLYAQEVQANLLNQLSRVGVAVPPALAFATSITSNYRAKGGAVEVMDLGTEETQCYYVPPRQSGQTGKAVFTHKFVQNLLNAVKQIDEDSVDEEDIKTLQALKNHKVQTKLVQSAYAGVSLEAPICPGVVLTAKNPYPNNSKDKPWCWITLTLPTITSAQDTINEDSTNLQPNENCNIVEIVTTQNTDEISHSSTMSPVQAEQAKS